jgi:hypothetical protein
MFQTMQPAEGEEEEEITVGDIDSVNGLSREDLQKELSKELEELQQPPSPSRRASTGAGSEAPPKTKKREGRVDTPPTETETPIAVTASE